MFLGQACEFLSLEECSLEALPAWPSCTLVTPSTRVAELPKRDARFPSMTSVFRRDAADTSLRESPNLSKAPKMWCETYVENVLSSEMEKDSQLKCTDG